jgi:hypothetical protein
LDETSVEKVRTKLGLSNVKYEVNLTVNVPENSGDVYITGNQSSIGNWNPNVIKLNKTGETTRQITFKTYPDLKFKLTKGNWETEGKSTESKKGKTFLCHWIKIQV